VSSSRCASCPAKGEPTRAGSQPCTGRGNTAGDAIAASNLVNTTQVTDRPYAMDHGEMIFAGAPQALFGHAEVIKTIRG